MWIRASSDALPATDVDRAIEKFNQGVDAFLQQPGLRRELVRTEELEGNST